MLLWVCIVYAPFSEISRRKGLQRLNKNVVLFSVIMLPNTTVRSFICMLYVAQGDGDVLSACFSISISNDCGV